MKPTEIVEHVLRQFDHENKVRLGEMLVAALEVKEEDDPVERAQGLLNRTLSEEEAFRLRTLVKFYHSRQDESPDGGFSYKASMTY
jgi:hypothetical protein